MRYQGPLWCLATIAALLMLAVIWFSGYQIGKNEEFENRMDAELKSAKQLHDVKMELIRTYEKLGTRSVADAPTRAR